MNIQTMLEENKNAASYQCSTIINHNSNNIWGLIQNNKGQLITGSQDGVI